MTRSSNSALFLVAALSLDLAACSAPYDPPPAAAGSSGAAAGSGGTSTAGSPATGGAAGQAAGSAGTMSGAGATGGMAGTTSMGGGAGSGGSSGGSAAGGVAGNSAGTTGGSGSSGAGAGETNGGAGGAGGSAGADTGGRSGGGAAGTASGAGQGGAGSSGGATGGGSGSAGAPPITTNPTLFIASDSTASAYGASTTQGGWGQFFAEHFVSGVTVVNRSRGGRNARRFIDAADEQSLELVWNAAEPGDYLFVQFGTNDSNNSASATYENVDGETIPYYLDPQTDFKTWLRVYIDGARERSVTPVLVTPPPRRSCSGDSHSFGNGTARWATAMKELAVEKGTALIDLNQKTLDYLNMIGCMASADFFYNNGTTVDGTHFSKTGAALMAGFVADGIAEAGLPLAAQVK